MFTWQQKMLLNSIVIGMDYHNLTREWILDKVALMYEFSPDREDIKTPIKDMYITIKNMSQAEWDDTESLLPFAAI